MEQIIKKAIEGGWKPWEYSLGIESERSTKEIVEVQEWEGNQKMVNIWHEKTGSDTGTKTVLAYEIVVCDSLFWQALCKDLNQGMWTSPYTDCGRYMKNAPRWLWEAMNFHEINLTKGWDKAVEYLQELLK